MKTNSETKPAVAHTPEWRVGEIEPGRYAIRILNQDGMLVALARGAGGPLADTRKHAALIVRAVNSHTALVAIAEALDKWEQDPDRYVGDLADLAHQARAALALAKGAQS